MKHFSIRHAYVDAYHLVIRHFGLFLLAYGLRAVFWLGGLLLVYRTVGSKDIMVGEVGDVFSPIPFSLPSLEQLQSAELNTLLVTAIITGILMVVDSFFVLGLIKMTLGLVRRGKSSITELWSSSLSLLFRVAILTLIYQLLVAVGLICFVIPGIIVAAAYSLSFMYLIDHDAKPFEALSGSMSLTKNNILHIIAFFIVSAIINGIGMIPFGLGTLFTGPLTLSAQVYVYRALSGRA